MRKRDSIENRTDSVWIDGLIGIRSSFVCFNERTMELYTDESY